MRNLGLDIAKCICTLWIVGVWHLTGYLNSTVTDSNVCGAITMTVLFCFMFISGMLMQKYDFNNLVDVKTFYLKRFWRFWILLLISCVSLFLAGLAVHKEWFVSIQQLILTICGLSSVFPPIPGTIWFMSMLMLFYMLTPIIRRKKNVVYTILSAFVVYLVFIILQVFGDGVDRGLFVYFPAFVLGLISPLDRVSKLTAKLSLCLYSIIAWPIIVLSTKSIENNVLNIVIQIVFSIFGTISLLGIGNLLSKVKGKVIIQCISVLSYSSLCLYLFHRQVYQGILFITRTLGIETSLLLMYIIMLPIALLVAYFIQKIYDKTISGIVS